MKQTGSHTRISWKVCCPWNKGFLKCFMLHGTAWVSKAFTTRGGAFYEIPGSSIFISLQSLPDGIQKQAHKLPLGGNITAVASRELETNPGFHVCKWNYGVIIFLFITFIVYWNVFCRTILHNDSFRDFSKPVQKIILMNYFSIGLISWWLFSYSRSTSFNARMQPPEITSLTRIITLDDSYQWF